MRLPVLIRRSGLDRFPHLPETASECSFSLSVQAVIHFPRTSHEARKVRNNPLSRDLSDSLRDLSQEANSDEPVPELETEDEATSRDFKSMPAPVILEGVVISGIPTLPAAAASATHSATTVKGQTAAAKDNPAYVTEESFHERL